MPIINKSAAFKLQYQEYYKQLRPILSEPRNRAYTTLILSVLAISLFSWYAIRPTVKTILYLRREISDKTLVNTQMEEKIAALIQAQANYQAVQADLPLINDAIPNNPQVMQLLELLNRLANTSQTTLASIEIKPIELLTTEIKSPKTSTLLSPKTSNLEYIISFAITGAYQDIRKFTANLISARRIVNIDGLSFSKIISTTSDSGIETTGIRLALHVKSYYFNN